MPKKILFLLPFIAVLVFLPALSGPLLLDDNIHLEPIIHWLANRDATFELVFGNQSGPFGRPVSISSFMLNALTTGAQIWPMKLTNLLLHLITGLCLAKLLHRLFNRDGNLMANAKIASVAAAGLWLILPQHVATVFYVIQRMTVLSTLFAVLACWLYVVARERLENNGKGVLPLLAGVIGFTLLSVLSKESGLLVPLYFFLIECIYFQPSIEKPRPKLVAWGFRLGVFLPCILVAAYLTFTPSFVLHGYIERPFSMPERVMTQIDVLADYFASSFVPMVRSAGVFNDDFPIATHLASKEYLLLFIGTGLIAAAIGLRKNYPSFSFGIALFFTGHLLESTIFPLEIYFAHRNYLPSIGLVLALFGLVMGFFHRHPAATTSFRRTVPIAFSLLFMTCAAASFSRALLWSNYENLMTHAQLHHPGSSRMRSEILLTALYAKRMDIALQQADIAMQTATHNEKRTIQLWRILAYCYAGTPQPQSELDTLNTLKADRITMATGTALGYVSAAAEVNACPGLDRKQLGILTSQWAVNTVQPSYSQWVWKTHFASARLLASSGDLAAGLKQARWAFYDSGFNFDAGLLAYQLANSLDDAESANDIMKLLNENKSAYSDLQQSQLHSLRNP